MAIYKNETKCKKFDFFKKSWKLWNAVKGQISYWQVVTHNAEQQDQLCVLTNGGWGRWLTGRDETEKKS
jgi:hypothetical protein